tara:strand:- start:887 stop:1297 length:411 start_codon:yes stop_codon:yes gene_type:complete
MSILYITVGIKHFTQTEFFITIVPEYIDYKKEAVLISGLIEIIMGLLLLFDKSRKIGALGIILLLIAVFPANIYLYMSDNVRDILKISKNQALLRMPFQIPLIILAYWHSKESHPKKISILCCILFIPTIIYFLTI